MRKKQVLAGLAMAALFVGIASLGQAQTFWNVTGPAPWVDPTNWTSGTGAAGSVVNNGGVATINPGDNAIDTSGNGAIFIGGSVANLGGDPAWNGNGYVTMSGGTLDSGSSGTLFMQEQIGVDASGIFTQSGGVNIQHQPAQNASSVIPTFATVQLGVNDGGYGEYDMSGGIVGPNAIFVGANVGAILYSGVSLNAGTGVFTQTGGVVGGLGTAGHANTAVALFVGGNWVANNTSNDPITTTSSGIYTLGNADGTPSSVTGQYPILVGGCEVIGSTGTGTFTQNSGTNALVGGGNFPGSIAVKVGAYESPYDDATGALLLGWYGGVQNFGGPQYVGNGVGTYTLNGGLLSGLGSGVGGYEVIGVTGTGIFNQTAGTNNPNNGLYVGGTNKTSVFAVPKGAGSGTYTLSGGSLATSVGEFIGSGGYGYFVQTGGTNTVNQIQLGGKAQLYPATQYTQMPGTYTLGGGLLQAGLIEKATGTGIGPATFNFTGGTLQAAAGGLSVLVPVTAAPTSNARLDMNGQAVSIRTLVTNSLTDLNFKTPGTDLLTISTGYTLTVGAGTEMTFGSLPAATPGVYYDLIAGDSNAASDLANFTLVGASGFTLAVDPNHAGDIALTAVPEPGTLMLLGVAQ